MDHQKMDSPNTGKSSDDSEYITVNRAIDIAGFGWFQWKLLFLTGAIWSADAMEIMFITFIIPVLRDYWNLKAPYDSMIGVMIFVGMFLGAYGWSWLSDRQGRRKVVIITNIIVAVFGTLSAFSTNFGSMLVLRSITGFGIGGSVVSYTLFAEYCSTNSRGWALIMEQGCFSFGAMLSVVLAWITLTNIDGQVAWRWYIGLSALPCWFLILAYRFIPESVRYYSANGQREKAELLLKKIFLENGKEWPEGLVLLCNQEQTKKGTTCDLFVPAYRCTSAIMLTNFFCAVFCYYGICFVSERLFKTGDLYSSMCFTTLSEVPGIFLAVAFIDRTGRKGMMNICWLFFGLMCLLIMLLPPTETTGSTQRGFDIIFVFLARCSVTILFLVIFVYFSEYYPTMIRSTALGLGSSLGRIAGMITTVIAEDLKIVDAMKIYSIFGFFSFVLTLLLPQDTTGMKMMDQVDRGEVEMSSFSRSLENCSEERKSNDIEVLHGGIKGKLQQFKAYLFGS